MMKKWFPMRRMKAKILTGAVAALLYSGAALAGEGKECPQGFEKKDTQASLMGSPSVMDESAGVKETLGVHVRVYYI